MQYILTENRTIVHLGPINWKTRFIQSELDDLEVDYRLPPTEQGYIKLNDMFELIPITNDLTPTYDPMYQTLAGPYYTYYDTEVTIYYTVQDRNLAEVKEDLKKLTASERYRRENMGIMVTVQNQQVFLDTSREGRNIFVQKYMLMGETETVNWKFPETWLVLTKQELGSIIAQGASYIQDQFNWELQMVESIDLAIDAVALQNITIVEPQIQPDIGPV